MEQVYLVYPSPGLQLLIDGLSLHVLGTACYEAMRIKETLRRNSVFPCVPIYSASHGG